MSLKSKKILIIDDDADFRNIIKKILQNLGMNVCEA